MKFQREEGIAEKNGHKGGSLKNEVSLNCIPGDVALKLGSSGLKHWPTSLGSGAGMLG